MKKISMDELTLENFLVQTGLRFRVSNHDAKLIEGGQLTREQAFQTALESGGLQKRVDQEVTLRNAWFDSDLTLANFKERTGRRFRLNRERTQLVESKVITREEAFAQTVLERRAEQKQETINAQ